MAQAARAALRGGLKRLSPRLTSMGGSRSDLKPEYLTRYRILESPGTRRVVLTATQSHTIDKRAAESLAWKLMAWENNYMIRAIIVQGQPRTSVYSSGWDKQTLLKEGPEAAVRNMRRYFQLAYLMATVSKPIACCYTGEVLGSGMGMGLGMYRFSSDDSIFQVTAPSYGWVLDSGLSFLLNNMRHSSAKALARYLALTGAPLSGTDLLAAGITTHHTDTGTMRKLHHRFGDLSNEVTDDDLHMVEDVMAAHASLYYRLDLAITPDNRRELQDEWAKNDEERKKMRKLLAESGLDASGAVDLDGDGYGGGEDMGDWEEDWGEGGGGKGANEAQRREERGPQGSRGEDHDWADADDDFLRLTEGGDWADELEEEQRLRGKAAMATSSKRARSAEEEEEDLKQLAEDEEEAALKLMTPEEREVYMKQQQQQLAEEGSKGPAVELFVDERKPTPKYAEGDTALKVKWGQSEVPELDVPKVTAPPVEAKEGEDDKEEGEEAVGPQLVDSWLLERDLRLPQELEDLRFDPEAVDDDDDSRPLSEEERAKTQKRMLESKLLQESGEEWLDAELGHPKSTAWYHRNFMDQQSAAFHALFDRMDERLVSRLQDDRTVEILEDLVLRYGDDKCPEYITFPERTKLVASEDVLLSPFSCSLDPVKEFPEFHALMAKVDKCFKGDSLEEVVSALEADGSEWSKACLSRMSALSPTSLRLVWAQLQEGAGLTLEDAMKMEYRVAARRMHDKEVEQSLSMGLGDTRGLKPGEAAPWGSRTFKDVTADEVASYFQPLSEKEHGPELDLPRRRLEGDRWDVGLGKRFRYTNKSF